MTAAAIPHLDRGPVTADPEQTWREYRALIEHAIANTPRELQTRIGPSELGNPCDRCLIHKLAGHRERRTGDWLPFVGTAVHEQLSWFFTDANAGLARVRYLVESEVSVGTVGGVDITGHVDLFDLDKGEVTDWKVVGATTLRKVKAQGPTATYKVQAHCYGRGFARRGVTVNRVRLAFLPRNEPSLRGAFIWTEPYDEQVALAAVARADALAAGIAAFGPDTVLAAAPPHTGSEFSCGRYDDAPPKPDTQLDGLIQTPDTTGAGSTPAR